MQDGEEQNGELKERFPSVYRVSCPRIRAHFHSIVCYFCMDKTFWIHGKITRKENGIIYISFYFCQMSRDISNMRGCFSGAVTMGIHGPSGTSCDNLGGPGDFCDQVANRAQATFPSLNF